MKNFVFALIIISSLIISCSKEDDTQTLTSDLSSEAFYDLKYPDGFNNMQPIFKKITSSSTYTVPTGKNFYFQKSSNYSFMVDDIWCKSDEIGIIPAQKTIKLLFADDSISISGFIVDAKYNAMIFKLVDKKPYIVPSGKSFVYLNNRESILINGSNFSNLNNELIPLVLPEGTIMSVHSESEVVINGYLK